MWTCGGTLLGEAARACKIEKKSIADVSLMPIGELLEWMQKLKAPSVAPLQARIVERLEHLVAIGLGYLAMGRETATLSGGESQRVKIVRHLGAALTERVYIFDEPTIGLPPHNIGRLNGVLRMLRGKGNTVLVVEHKPEVMAIADHIVDMGPGAGKEGGEVVFEGTFAALKKSGTKTGKHLAQHASLKTEYREEGHPLVETATLNNLRKMTVKIPKGVLTGVTGNGKSSLIHGCLPKNYPGAVFVDQSLAAGSRRSNLTTYSGMADAIRRAFATSESHRCK